MDKAVYLDYNSTTPVDPIVLETMLPYFNINFGNAASRTHVFGWEADEAVENAREQLATFIGAEKNEILFTSGATESINLSLKGVFEAYKQKGNHIVTVATEHKAVLDTCKHLEQQGAIVTYLPVDTDGLINLHQLRKNISDNTIMVCVMFANNETGVIQPMKEIAGIVHEKGSILMSDATQACGKIDVNVKTSGIDLMSFSSHKIYGPKGCGALYVRRRGPRVHLAAQMHGGGHENGRRSGTLNVPGIVGFGKACDLSRNIIKEEGEKIAALRNKVEQVLLTTGRVKIHGNNAPRLTNTCNLCIEGFPASLLIKKMSSVAIATGSACTSALPEASHVLKAMGVSEERALSSLRFSLGRFTTEAEVEIAGSKLIEIINRGAAQ